MARVLGPTIGLDRSELLGPKPTDAERRTLLLEAAGARSTWTPELLASELERLGVAAWVKAHTWLWRGKDQDGFLADWTATQYRVAASEANGIAADLHKFERSEDYSFVDDTGKWQTRQFSSSSPAQTLGSIDGTPDLPDLRLGLVAQTDDAGAIEGHHPPHDGA
jgi:hypothetical protein